MILLENIKIAFQSILSNKMRSMLTMLGIIIGIGSVISIVSIGDSMKSMVDEQYASVGKNLAIFALYNMETIYSTDFITMDDLELIQERFKGKIDYIAPGDSYQSDVTMNRRTIKLSMSCVLAGYDQVQDIKMLYGRMINQSDVDRRSKCIVLEQQAAIKLFGRDNVTGNTVRVKLDGNMEDLLIIGVYKVEKSLLESLMGGGSMYESSFIPLTIVPEYGGYYNMNLYVNKDYSVSQVGWELCEFVAKMKNRQPENYYFYSAEEEMGMMNSMLSGLSLAVGAIAAISLLVGGIGIMNIMLVSVTERTREIGIKKALGARTKDVLSQFLIEAAVLSALGGVLGTAAGIGLVSLGGSLISIPIVINPNSIFIAVVFAMIIGLFFGYYPAKKAAKADPVESLRYE